MKSSTIFLQHYSRLSWLLQARHNAELSTSWYPRYAPHFIAWLIQIGIRMTLAAGSVYSASIVLISLTTRWNDLFSLYHLRLHSYFPVHSFPSFFLSSFSSLRGYPCISINMSIHPSSYAYLILITIALSLALARFSPTIGFSGSVRRIVHIFVFTPYIPGQDHTTIHCRCFSAFLLAIYIHTSTHRSPTR